MTVVEEGKGKISEPTNLGSPNVNHGAELSDNLKEREEEEEDGVMLEEARLVVELEDMETREMETVREEDEDEDEEEGEEARDSLGLGSLEGVRGAMGNSRTSLQSRGSGGGLSRWSTEENLSLDGSREALNMSGSREVLMGGCSSREALNISGSREVLMMGTSSSREEEVHERLSSPPNKEGAEQRNDG